MEYCAHCRAIRPTRKSTRKRTVRQPDGTMKTLVVDSYHCTRCNHFIGSVERDAAPAATPHPDAATEETSAVASEEGVDAASGSRTS